MDTEAKAELQKLATTHTPGPWATRPSRDGSGDIGITTAGVPNIIAECFSAMRSHNENAFAEAAANACLISAAPDLLDAAKAARVVLDRVARYSTLLPQDEKARGALHAAISKAEPSHADS